MLVSLHIENVATVKHLDIEFDRGFTVMTGQTGAGKSVITDCINLLTGERSDRELIRRGEDKAKIEAVFSDLSASRIEEIEGLGISCGDGLMLSRELYATGKSVCRCNGKIVPIYMLKEISQGLLSIQGQNSSQRLLRTANHVAYLDAYAETTELFSRYGLEYSKLLTLNGDLKRITQDGKEKAYRASELKKSIEEIDKAKLKEGEEEELNRSKERIKNSEALIKYTSVIYRSLYRSEKNPSAVDKIERAQDALEALNAMSSDPEIEKYKARLDGIAIELEEIAMYAADLTGGAEIDTGEALDRIEDRLSLIRRLKRRYGEGYAEIMKARDEMKAEYEGIINSESEANRLREEIKLCRKAAAELALELSQKRQNAAKRLKAELENEFNYLDLARVKFDAGVTVGEKLTQYGIDSVEFLIATNIGDQLQPLSRIASGGELARIMLAMNSVFANKDSTDTVIYDEADAGISGATSDRVGKRMRKMSEYCQVIAVTHAAQIASHANEHLLIYKTEKDDRAETSVASLDRDGRIKELSRILGGVEITDAVSAAAAEMLDNNA